ncbi:HAD family hydrolase [Corynebacterium sp. H130]|uniref:HAD family hydrolase n=1 Tax=Corynebacterium sp. H130 TaxID=3133444 RepID=UPI0030A82508
MTYLFDLYGVLLKTQSDQALRDLESVLNTDESLWPVYWEYRPDFDAGRVSEEEYWELVRAKLDLEPFDVQKAIEVDYAGWLEADEEMVERVKTLKPKGLLSNIPEGLAKKVLEKHTWLQDFDAIAMSCEIGVEKPQREAYEIALQRLKAKPEETHFFDDNEANVQAAKELGINATLFTGIEVLK